MHIIDFSKNQQVIYQVQHLYKQLSKLRYDLHMKEHRLKFNLISRLPSLIKLLLIGKFLNFLLMVDKN